MDEWGQKNEALNEGFLAENRGSLGDIVTDADMWFEALQEVLDAGDCHVNLNVPEQSIRLAVFTIEDIGDDEHRITPFYAMDPQQRPIDLANITEEEALSRQSATLPEPVIQELYQAAKEGRFFVRGNQNSEHRQILVGTNGLPRLGNSFEHPSEEDERYQVSPQEPTIPKKPGRSVRRQAEAGDLNAQMDIEDYETAVTQHREWKESMALRARNPEKARIADAMMFVSTEYYMSMENDGIAEYGKMVNRIQQQYAFSQLSPAEQDYRKYAEQTEMQVSSLREGILTLKRAGKLNLDAPLCEEATLLLAEKLAYREELRRVQAWDVSRYGAIEPKNPAEMQAAAQAIRESPAFSVGMQRLTGKVLDELLSVEYEKFGRELDKLWQKIEDPQPAPEAQPAAQPDSRPVLEPEVQEDPIPGVAPQPVPDLDVLARRFRSLHDRLKQDDSRWNWRNSDQYDKLLTALESAASAFSGASGYLDDEEQEALRQSVAEVARRAEAYQTHIGAQGKNARQQRRLEMTGEVMTLVGGIYDGRDDSRWQAFTEGHNAKAREEYYSQVHDLTGNIPTEDEINANERLSPAERFEQRERAQARQSLKRIEDDYDAGVQRTEELRERIERGQTDADRQYLTKVDTEVLQARESLTKMVAQNALEPKQVQAHIATVIAGTETHLVNIPNGEMFFRARKQMYETSPALKSMVQESSVKELTEFLTGPGEHRFTDRLKGRMRSPLYAQERQQPKAAPEKAPEVQKKSERSMIK